ncbi:hypothetical protein BC941DRAFT_445467 [Chlamydoabsidia padenii]|nr:hypothetical protein BC941DRAFT_445467 [Chlamydoabsidia padenii]
MVSFTVFTCILTILLFAGHTQADGTQGGHTGGVQGTHPVAIKICQHQGKCDWSLAVEKGDSFTQKNTNCDHWTTPKGTNGVYKIKNFDDSNPLSEIVLDVAKCDYYKMVTRDKFTHPTKGTKCHLYTAKIC